MFNKLSKNTLEWLWAIFNEKTEEYYRAEYGGVNSSKNEEFRVGASKRFLQNAGFTGLAVAIYERYTPITDVLKGEENLYEIIYKGVKLMKGTVKIKELQTYFEDDIDSVFNEMEEKYKKGN